MKRSKSLGSKKFLLVVKVPSICIRSYSGRLTAMCVLCLSLRVSVCALFTVNNCFSVVLIIVNRKERLVWTNFLLPNFVGFLLVLLRVTDWKTDFS